MLEAFAGSEWKINGIMLRLKVEEAYQNVAGVRVEVSWIMAGGGGGGGGGGFSKRQGEQKNFQERVVEGASNT